MNLFKKIISFIHLGIFCLLCSYPQSLISQTRETDSIINLLKTVKDDTVKVNSLIILSKKLHNLGELDASFQYANKARDLAIKLDFLKGEAKAYNRIGNLCMDLGNISAAIKNHQAAIRIRSKINDKVGLSSSYNDIGNAYFIQGDYFKALENFFAALKIKEELKDYKGLSSTYNNIGNVYLDFHNYAEAIKNYASSLKFAKVNRDKPGIASAYSNLGLAYQAQHNYADALRSQTESVNMRLAIGDKENLAKTYGNIAALYDDMGNYEEALKNCFASLKLYNETGDEQGMGIIYCNMAVSYLKLEKYKESEKYGLQALEIANRIGDLKGIREANHDLSKLYTKLNKPEKALPAYINYIKARDSLINEDNTKKTIRLEMNYVFQKKAIADSLRVADEKKIVAIQLEQEKLQRFALYGGLGLVLLFAIFIVSRLRISQKQKKIIEQQKKEVEQQKELVDEKQKEVMDSIHYAQRIQKALLASDNLLKQNLPGYFIFYKPKDIVSGDFYWATKNHNKFYIVTADSTGHGVPGAFMSLLNISFLNEAITEKGLQKPSEILNHTRTRLIDALKLDGSEEGGKDGMDCTLLAFDFFKNEINYAAANNDFFIIRDKQIIAFPADKMPVGKSPKDTEPFTLKTVSIQKGDIVYTMTDGFQDQFGGPKGKKFKSKHLQQLILANCHLPLQEQQKIIENAFEQWKGNLEQLDDVCLIGIKI